MRSVFVFLRHATADEVQDYLSRTYSSRRGSTWVLDVAGDAALYIHAYDHHQDSKAYSTLIRSGGGELLEQFFGHQPSLIISADVSGRHPGDDEVIDFVSGLLGQFDGVAMDEYSDHFWTVDQIRAGFKAQGHPFFDYRGWHEEWSRGST